MEYQLRYTCSGDLQNQIVDFITRNANKYIIAKEFASREHIHCYIVLDITKKTWVNKFNLKFTGMCRRDKYVELDKGNSKLYVCKDGNILAKRGFTDEDIENFKTEYHNKHLPVQIPLEIEEILISPPEKKDEKVKKQKKPTFMTECRNELMDEYPMKEWDKKDKCIVFKKIMYKLGQGCRSLDHIIISRMTYGVLNSLVKDKKEWLEYWFMKSFGEIYNCDDTDESDIFTDSKYVF